MSHGEERDWRAACRGRRSRGRRRPTSATGVPLREIARLLPPLAVRAPRGRTRGRGPGSWWPSVRRRRPQTLTEAGERDQVSTPSMSQTRVEPRSPSAGYAVRARDPDDRSKVLFSATADGDELAGAARAERDAWLDQRLQALSAEDRAVIARAAVLLCTEIADS